MKYIYILLISTLAVVSCSPKSASDAEVTTESIDSTNGVFFSNIKEGDSLISPFLLEMGVKGMLVEPKGEPKVGVGHHHLLINDGAIPEGIVIVADSTHIHYGGGQTSDSVRLQPGNYKLTLQFADGMHVSYGEKWSTSVNVTIK